MLLMDGPTNQICGADDWELANRAQTDRQSLDLLFRRHRDFVFRVIWSQIGRKSAAEDLTQEVFIRIATGRRKLFRRAAFRTWLYRIAANLVRDHRRKQKWEMPLDEIETGGATDAGQQALSDILGVVDRLPRRQREVVLLRILEGMSTAETAAALGISQGSVKTHLHRGMERLRIELS